MTSLPAVRSRFALHWAVKYLGMPYKDQGRDFEGVDCWGLIWLVYTTEGVAEIPSYGTMSQHTIQEAMKTIQADSAGKDWVQVVPGTEEEFDVVLLDAPLRLENRLRLIPFHVGVVTSPGVMMHIEEGTEVCVVPFRDTETRTAHPSVGRRVVGIYRHNAGQ